MTVVGLRATTWLMVSEPAPRWAPALKALIAQQHLADTVLRVESLSSLPRRSNLVDLHSPTLLMLEVDGTDLPPQLAWIRSVVRSPAVAAVALLARDVRHFSANRRQLLTAGLREAGAAAVLSSTGELPTLLGLAARHSAVVANQHREIGSLRDWVGERLPWQPVPGPLG